MEIYRPKSLESPGVWSEANYKGAFVAMNNEGIRGFLYQDLGVVRSRLNTVGDWYLSVFNQVDRGKGGSVWVIALKVEKGEPKLSVNALVRNKGGRVTIRVAQYGSDGSIHHGDQLVTFEDPTGILTKGMPPVDQLPPKIDFNATVNEFTRRVETLDYNNPTLLVPVQAR